MDSDSNKEDAGESTASSEPSPMKAKLKVIVRYLVLGFAPVVSLLALVIAVMAYSGNQSNRIQINEANSRVNGLSASMNDLKGEQDLFKLPFGHEKSAMSEERRKQGEREAKIIKNVTQLQTKLKIAPTLEEQLQQAVREQEVAAPVASAPAVSHPVSSAVATPAATPLPAVNEKKTAAVPQASETKPPVRKEAESKPAAVQQSAAQKSAPVQKESEKKSAPAAKGASTKPATPPKTDDKTSSKVQSLKEAIKIYNQSN